MIKLGDKEYPFEKYTMRHAAFIEDHCGYGMTQLMEEMQKKPISSMVKLIYTGIQAGCDASSIPCKWSEKDIKAACFDVGIEGLSELLAVKENKKKEGVST